MKLIKHFDNFLQDAVNLNQTRMDKLRDRVATIEAFLTKAMPTLEILEFSPQGSWAHGTIIRPQGNKGFDADLIMLLNPHTTDFSEVVDNIYTAFFNAVLYKEKIERGTRCVTLSYADEFSIDLVPVFKVDQGLFFKPTYAVFNRKEGALEQTDSKKYTLWLDEKNKAVGQDLLRKTVRLLKYLRDIKGCFSAKSILLTTLIGQQVMDQDATLTCILTNSVKTPFLDLPTTLKILVDRLDDWLQKTPDMPIISNPTVSTENFNRHWDQAKYATFRESLHRYRIWIDDAYDEPNTGASILKWRRIFGDEFAMGASE